MASSGSIRINEKSGKLVFSISDYMQHADKRSAFAFSFAEELLTQSKRIGQLISHRGTVGGYREELLRNLLKKSLPERYHVATGFISYCDLQLDIIVYDRIDYAPLFREGDLVVVPHNSVRAVIEVKTQLTTTELRDSLDHLAGLPFEVGAPIFKGIFAFGTDIASESIIGHISSFYESDELMWGPYEEVSAICVVNKHLILTGYSHDPVQPIIARVENFLGRNFHAAVFVDVMFDYLRSSGITSLREGIPIASSFELNSKATLYMREQWSTIEQNSDFLAKATSRIKAVKRWLSGEANVSFEIPDDLE